MIAHYRLPMPSAWEDLPDPETGGTVHIITAFDPCPHVNIAARDMTAALNVYRIHPGTPLLVMAGDTGPDWLSTVFLRFSSESEMAAAIGAETQP